MKYVPKELEGNVNVEKSSPLLSFLLYLLEAVAFTVFLYYALGFAVEMAVSKLPPATEARINRYFASLYSRDPQEPAELYLQGILNSLSGEGERYRVSIVEDATVNAAALPGGQILVYRGLIEKVKSENELAYVLAHEVGHHRHRDHLLGMGRALVLVTLSSVLSLGSEDFTDFFIQRLNNVQMRYSQRQEGKADEEGVELLNKRYGHVGGATDFFERMAETDTRSRWFYMFATHPYPPDRIEGTKRYIASKGYRSKATVPMDSVVVK